MKQIKVFLFCIGGFLSIIAGIAVSRPIPTVGTEATVSSEYISQAQTEKGDYVDEDTVTFIDTSDDISDECIVEPTSELTEKAEVTSTTAVHHEIEATTIKSEKPEITSTTRAVETTSEPEKVLTTVVLEENENMTVYITKTGSHYHYANPCGNGTYYATTLGEAKEKGLTPCSKCVH